MSFPIRATVNAVNCRNETMNVGIKVNNEIVDSRNITINSDRFSQTIDFMLQAYYEGSMQIEVFVDGLKNEIQTKTTDDVSLSMSWIANTKYCVLLKPLILILQQ